MADSDNRVALSQWLTPVWAAEELVSMLDLTPADKVLEPSCGDGSFLKAIPEEIEAVGVEIDPAMAELARQNTGRLVITGDFMKVDIPIQPTLVVGNPPFKIKVVRDFLKKSYSLLPSGGRLAFLLSTHLLQTPRTVAELFEGWGVDHRLVPRTLFNKAIRPLSFITLTKGGNHCTGMALYPQALFINQLPRKVKKVANNGQKSVWLRVVSWAMDESGGEATLTQIYSLVGQNRPTPTPWFKEKCRQVLQKHFQQVERGKWSNRNTHQDRGLEVGSTKRNVL
jgi:site-specific DNA-methyltransferase (adenine-specific)